MGCNVNTLQGMVGAVAGSAEALQVVNTVVAHVFVYMVDADIHGRPTLEAERRLPHAFVLETCSKPLAGCLVVRFLFAEDLHPDSSQPVVAPLL